MSIYPKACAESNWTIDFEFLAKLSESIVDDAESTHLEQIETVLLAVEPYFDEKRKSLTDAHETMEKQLREIMNRKDSEILELDKTKTALRTCANNLDKALTKAVLWMENPVEKPDHDCANPDSGCDMECNRWVNFCDDLKEFKNLVGKDGGG